MLIHYQLRGSRGLPPKTIHWLLYRYVLLELQEYRPTTCIFHLRRKVVSIGGGQFQVIRMFRIYDEDIHVDVTGCYPGYSSKFVNFYKCLNV